MPLAVSTRTSVEELCAKYGAELPHARHVATLALTLFDATHGLFGVPAEDRACLEAACLLHDVGYAADPRRHAEVGADLVRRRGAAGLTGPQVRLTAALIRLHSAPLDFASARDKVKRLPDPGRALCLGGLLRIADALDYCHLQDAAIGSVRVVNRKIRVSIHCPQFPRAVEVARRQASWWREAFPADIDLRLSAGGPRSPLVSSTLPLHEAVRRLLFLQYRTMLLNVDGALSGAGDEYLHDLRIAIRRMRAVLRAFRKPLASESGQRIEGDLQRLNRILGIARDLDVWIGFFSDETVSSKFTGHRLWAAFVSHQLELRRLQQTTVRRQLHGARFNALRIRIGRFLRVELPAAAIGSFVPVDGPARRAMAKSLRRALELGHLRNTRSPEKLHRLRIALRRVRYLGAFFGAALGRPVRKLSKRTHAIERLLGEMRDADLALARVLQEGPTPPRLLVRQLERIRQTDSAALESAWNRFEEPQFILSLRRELKH